MARPKKIQAYKRVTKSPLHLGKIIISDTFTADGLDENKLKRALELKLIIEA